MSDALKTIEELCSFERRAPGSDAERRAANHFAGRLRELGRKTRIEPIHVHPQAPLIHTLHCALAFAGSLTSIASPAVGFALVLLAATSLYLDLNTRAYLLRRLFFRRASQNVVSPGPNPTAPARLLIVAHLDAARSGYAFGPRAARAQARFARLAGFAPSRLVFWSSAALLPMLGTRMAGLEADAVSLFQLPPTLILLVSAFLLLDVQLSDVVPGANDNASGVAVAMSLAAELRREATTDLDVWIVLSGGEECGGQGMRSFARSDRKQHDPSSTFVLAIDSVGAGELRYVTAEGLTVAFEMDRRLVELCEAVAQADGEAQPAARPLARNFATDALAARVAGLRATALTTLEREAVLPANHHTHADTPEAVDPKALERTTRFARDLIRALDRDVGRASRPAGGDTLAK